jgi:hypothetical protein
MATPGDPSNSNSSITERLEAATSELHVLEEVVKSGNLDSRVLSEFRNAVDHIRGTTWAVQKWLGLNTQSGGDPFSVLPIMSAERVKRATQITNDLSLDLQTVDVGFDTPGIFELLNAVDEPTPSSGQTPPARNLRSISASREPKTKPGPLRAKVPTDLR